MGRGTRTWKWKVIGDVIRSQAPIADMGRE